jgi:hypothetical protein
MYTEFYDKDDLQWTSRVCPAWLNCNNYKHLDSKKNDHILCRDSSVHVGHLFRVFRHSRNETLENDL